MVWGGVRDIEPGRDSDATPKVAKLAHVFSRRETVTLLAAFWHLDDAHTVCAGDIDPGRDS